MLRWADCPLQGQLGKEPCPAWRGLFWAKGKPCPSLGSVLEDKGKSALWVSSVDWDHGFQNGDAGKATSTSCKLSVESVFSSCLGSFTYEKQVYCKCRQAVLLECLSQTTCLCHFLTLDFLGILKCVVIIIKHGEKSPLLK